jgi:hypothetical protein
MPGAWSKRRTLSLPRVLGADLRRRSGLTATVASAMGWSPNDRFAEATEPSHQEVIPTSPNVPVERQLVRLIPDQFCV